MRDAFRVTVIYCLHDLSKDCPRVNFAEKTSFDDSVKQLAAFTNSKNKEILGKYD